MLSHLRHSQGYLTAGMLHAEGFPCLTIKAHNGRLMLVFLDLCLATYIRSTRDAGGTPSSEVVNVSLATRALCGWYDAVERAGRYLTRDEADTIYNYGFSFKNVSAIGGGVGAGPLTKVEVNSKTTRGASLVGRYENFIGQLPVYPLL